MLVCAILIRFLIDYSCYLLRTHHKVSFSAVEYPGFINAKRWRYKRENEEFSIKWYCELAELDYGSLKKLIIKLERDENNKELLLNLIKGMTKYEKN